MGKYRTKGDDFYNKKIIVKIYFINKLLNVIFKYENHENKIKKEHTGSRHTNN